MPQIPTSTGNLLAFLSNELPNRVKASPGVIQVQCASYDGLIGPYRVSVDPVSQEALAFCVTEAAKLRSLEDRCSLLLGLPQFLSGAERSGIELLKARSADAVQEVLDPLYGKVTQGVIQEGDVTSARSVLAGRVSLGGVPIPQVGLRELGVQPIQGITVVAEFIPESTLSLKWNRTAGDQHPSEFNFTVLAQVGPQTYRLAIVTNQALKASQVVLEAEASLVGRNFPYSAVLKYQGSQAPVVKTLGGDGEYFFPSGQKALTDSVPANPIANLTSGGPLDGMTENFLNLCRIGQWADQQFVSIKPLTLFRVNRTAPVLASPPSLVTQPESQQVPEGGSATFRVSASGTGSLTFQWRKDGTNLQNATDSELTINNVKPVHAGTYDVIVRNAAGPVTSNPAMLTVITAPATQVSINVSSAPSSGGSVTGGGSFNSGSSVTVTATPAAGYTFGNWTENGALASASRSYTFTVNANRTLVANFLPLTTTTRTLEIGKGSGGPGAVVDLPLTLNADGTENALSFSLAFPPTQAAFGGLTLAGALTGASLVVNTNQATSGRVGVVLSLPVNQSIARGALQLATVRLNLAASLSAGSVIPIQFANSPAPKSASDALGGDLPVNYVDGSITIVTGYEGDVAPRPNGNNLVNAADVTVMGRIIAGLESNLSVAEFQRADCAPRSSSGNGAITVGDLTQVARYVAGLDAQTSAGGPTGPSVGPSGLSGNREAVVRKSTVTGRRVSVLNAAVAPGGMVTASVQMAAQGDENALSFSVAFDAAKLTFASASLGSGATGASLVTNPEQTASGKLGIVISLPVNQSLKPGSLELLKITFLASPAAGSAAIGFGNTPALESVSDALGNDLACQFVDGLITISAGTQTLPVISAQPSSVSAALGGSATLSVSATGATTYQWQVNGKDIPGANGPTLTLNHLPAESAGLYTVVVGNSSGSVTSALSALTLFGDLKLYAGVTLAGPVGTRFRVEYTDAIDGAGKWQTLLIIALPSSPYLVIDPQSPGQAQRYYRAVVLP